MNRANQYALYQQTNQGLLGIRQAEINYYVGLCVAFGTQAALIGGFTYGVFTQNQYNEDLEYASWFQDVYWVSSSGTIAASVHVILTSMLIQVFGPGLALHGPIGSMARACEGMRREQRSVITSFIIMIVLFSISTILSFWAVMTTEAAAGATAVWLIATRYYYYYCERIYLRFYWKEETDYWRRSADFSDDPAGIKDDYEPPEVSKTREKLSALHQAHAERSSESSVGERGVHDPPLQWDPSAPLNRSNRSSQDGRRNDKPKSKIFRILPTFKRGKAKTSNKSSVDNPLNASLLANQVADNHGAQNPRALAMEGFLLIRRFSYSQSTENRKSYKWDRRYFILNFLGHMFYYKSRGDFREYPRRPIHKRPILLHDFYAEVYNSEIDGESGFSFRSSVDGSVNFPRANSITSTLMAAHEASKPGKTTGQHIFEIKLIPREMEDHKTLTVENLVQHQSRTNFNAAEDDMSDSDHDSITFEDRAAGNYAKKSYRRDWILRCDTAEELTVWVDIIREVCPSCFRLKN